MMILTAILFCGSFQTQAQHLGTKVYFSAKEMPDLIKYLPPPPDTIGMEFAYDIMRYEWGKTQRCDSVRAAIARRDAKLTFKALFAEFSVPFGLKISKKSTPEIYKLLVNSVSTIDQTRVKPKAYYKRKRPFVHFHEHMLTTSEELFLSFEGSYPSGHGMRGYAVALLLSEINPANADSIMARGYMYGESRVIVGAHWQSDVDASRLGAAIGVIHLHTSEAFMEQLSKAQAEFKQLTMDPEETIKKD